MHFTDNLSFQLLHLAATLSKQNDLLLQQELGLGFSQFKILIVLQWKPSITQKQIAEKLNQSEASISRQINIMYEEGLLQTMPSDEDKRQHITTLTQRGQRICTQAAKILDANSDNIFNVLSKNERDALLNSFKTMNNSLQNKTNQRTENDS